MRTFVAFIALVTTAALLFAPAAQAQSTMALTMEADDGDTCIESQALDCFRVTDGSLDALQTGMFVHVTLENVGENPHNVFVTEEENADMDTRDTSAGDAINGSETIESGEETTFTFTVPDDAESLYFWCDVGPHETFGMHLTGAVEQAPSDDQDQDDDQGTQAPEGDEQEDEQDAGEQEEQSTPLPGIASIVVTLTLAAAALTRLAPSS